MMNNLWNIMSQIDIRQMTESKNGFTYLSWAHAYRLLKQHAPHAKVTKHLFEVDGRAVPFMRDEQGYAYVQVTVDLGEGNVTAEVMPVLNHANRPIQNPNSFEVNASLQRCMAKAISMACGLGIHLYVGEAVPAPTPQSVGRPAEDTVPAMNKLDVPVTIADRVRAAADMDALKALYQEVQLNLTADDRQLFSARKQELMNG